MKIDEIATTNKLLLVIIIPLVFFLLQIFSFIFVPFMFAVFIGLLFTPLMRWLKKRHIHKYLSLLIVLGAIVACFFIAIKAIQLTSSEISAGKHEIFEKLDSKVAELVGPIREFLGLEAILNEQTIKQLLMSEEVKDVIYGNFGITITFVKDVVVKTLLTFFFLILLLAGSLNLKVFLQEVLLSGRTQSVKTFISIERSVSMFLKVKFVVSLATGIAFGLTCYFMGISFPIFWGLFAFGVNFIQMIGSIVVTVLAILFASIEIEHSGMLLGATLLFIGAQVVFGSIVEPILLGRSFSINIIIVLISLMFWGFLWGVPGLVLAIPMTVLIKTVLQEFSGTESIARLMS